MVPKARRPSQRASKERLPKQWAPKVRHHELALIKKKGACWVLGEGGGACNAGIIEGWTWPCECASSVAGRWAWPGRRAGGVDGARHKHVALCTVEVSTLSEVGMTAVDAGHETLELGHSVMELGHRAMVEGMLGNANVLGGNDCRQVVDGMTRSGETSCSHVLQGSPSSGPNNASLYPHTKKHRGKVALDDDGSNVSTISSPLNIDANILRIVSTSNILLTVLCCRAEIDESACDDSSGDTAIYEEVLEARL
ncbi:unnamed protein product, partial [Ilex paraguariensis]